MFALSNRQHVAAVDMWNLDLAMWDLHFRRDFKEEVAERLI